MLTAVEAGVEQAQDREGEAEVAQRGAAVCAVEGALAGAQLDQFG
jgi:hypothetical protein